MAAAAVGFHDNFWVVAGTAAPVIALAVIVSTGDVLREFLISTVALNSARRLDPTAVRLGAPRRTLDWLIAIGLFNLFLQTALLSVSLVSLADGANLTPPWVAVAAAVAGLLLLPAAAVGNIRLRALRMFAQYLETKAQKADQRPDDEVTR
jgi:hypothetical protein